MNIKTGIYHLTSGGGVSAFTSLGNIGRGQLW